MEKPQRHTTPEQDGEHGAAHGYDGFVPPIRLGIIPIGESDSARDQRPQYMPYFMYDRGASKVSEQEQADDLDHFRRPQARKGS